MWPLRADNPQDHGRGLDRRRLSRGLLLRRAFKQSVTPFGLQFCGGKLKLPRGIRSIS
jgi:hypothetical protein